MKAAIILLFLCMFSGTLCLAQGTSNGGRAVASSQIRVSIPSYAVINLATNSSRSISYNSSSELKNAVRLNANTKIEANDKWSVTVVRERDDTDNKETTLSKTASPTYTVIYVSTQI